mmetsp:Transcript_9734/g.30498  ORF Transcript_9734/g.30498 Transcript_9734/m.30498 type:complete len:235 (-) Transcript_9734:576-1280(-)
MPCRWLFYLSSAAASATAAAAPASAPIPLPPAEAADPTPAGSTNRTLADGAAPISPAVLMRARSRYSSAASLVLTASRCASSSTPCASPDASRIALCLRASDSTMSASALPSAMRSAALAWPSAMFTLASRCPSLSRMSARFTRSAVICFSNAILIDWSGNISLTSTRVTQVPHSWAVESSSESSAAPSAPRAVKVSSSVRRPMLERSWVSTSPSMASSSASTAYRALRESTTR